MKVSFLAILKVRLDATGSEHKTRVHMMKDGRVAGQTGSQKGCICKRIPDTTI